MWRNQRKGGFAMEKFFVDFTSGTLTITAKFAKAMINPNSDEYKLVARYRKDFPYLTIAGKTRKSPARYRTGSGETYSCNPFKNLTYDRMEHFMDGLPQKEQYRREYDFVKDYASTVQHNGYAVVRKWFVAQFPDFRKNPLTYLHNTPELLPASDFLGAEEQISA